MPHHTLGSWRTHLSIPSVRDEIDRLRKRAGIVFRKAQEQKQSHAAQSVPEQQDESEVEDPVTPIAPSPTLVGESDTDKKKMTEEDELNFIAAFFVVNLNEGEDESVVWDRLSSQVFFYTLSDLHLLIVL